MRKIFGIIYKITNLINGKIYIGQTTQSLKARWRQHCNDEKSCRVLHYAIKKYGKENFILEIVAECKNVVEMNLKEVFYIKYFDTLVPNGYNLLTGGNHPEWSEESKKLMSDIWNNKSEEERARIGEKISASNKIAQNKPELKKQKSDFHKVYQNLPEQKKEKAEFQIIYQNLPEVVHLNSETQKISQNRPEIINKKKETWAKKSEEEMSAFIKIQSENNKIRQNIPEVKSKRKLSWDRTWSKKSEEERSIINKNKSNAAKKIQDRPEVIQQHIKNGKKSAHIRHHFNKGVLNLDCEHCIAQVMKEHS